MRTRWIAAAVAAAGLVLVAATSYAGRMPHGPGAAPDAAPAAAAAPAFHESRAVVPGQFSARTFTEGRAVIRYQVFFPTGYDATKKWPVIVALHGSAEKGSDGVRQIGVGVGKVVRAAAGTFPAVVVFPQVPNEGKVLFWTPTMMRLITAVVHEVSGDPDRVYLTGLSMGGILAYDLAYHNPGAFAALVTVSAPVVMQPGLDRATRLPSSESHPAQAKALGKTPVWIFQGASDPAAPASETRHLVGALQTAGVPVKYTEYADGGHDVWDRAYTTPELWTWLLAQHR